MRNRILSLSLACAALAPAAAVRAQVSPADPFWPLTVKLPEALGGYPPPAPGKPVPADLRVWLPEGATTLRAVMLVPENSDSKHVAEHAPLRAVATKHGMGIIYMRGFKTGIEHLKDAPPPDGKNLLDMLDIVATESGVASFREAPWVVFGKSSRGEFPFMAAWVFPERVIAGVTYHGQTPTWPIPDWSKAGEHSILWLNANGETEWGGTWFNHVRPSLLNYRRHSEWLPHIAIAKDVGHGDYADGHGSGG